MIPWYVITVFAWFKITTIIFILYKLSGPYCSHSPMTIYSILAKFSKSRTSFGPFGGHKTMIKASAEIPLQPPCAPFSTDGCWWLAMNRTKCCLSAASCNFAPLIHWRLPLVHYDALWSTMVCSVQPKVQKQDRGPTCSVRWQQFSVTKHFSALYYMAFITFLMRRIQTPVHYRLSP